MPYNTLPQDRLKLREQNYQTAVYLVFKLMGSGTAQDAVKQIKEKGYAEPYRMSGKKIGLIGAVFNDEITPHYDGDYAEYWMLEELV